MYRLLFFIVSLSLSQALMACGGYSCNNPSLNINGTFGLSQYSNAMNNDGQTAVGRLSIGGMLYRENLGFGLEGGIQTGNTMHLNFPKEDLFILGGVPFEAEIKPLLDFLLSLQIKLNDDSLFGVVKGGLAFRQMQVDEQAVNDLRDTAPEIQAGFSYQIGEQLFINLMYQYVFGKAPILIIDPMEERGLLTNIPSQQALMLGVSYSF